MSCKTTTIVAATLIAILAPISALADPPGRVARVSYVGGSVSFRPASSDEWTNATLNYPVTIGDHVWTDSAARTELELGVSTVRLAPFTEFSVLNLDDHIAQFRISQGALSMRVRELAQGDAVEIDTPAGAVSVLRPGLYRVDVNESGDTTTVTVRRGDADIAAGTSFPIHENQSVVLTNASPSPSAGAAIVMDDFENWALTRDRREETAQATGQVSPQMIGVADLAQYGSWRDAPEYGTVWVPRVGAEWVPYRYGHWVWIDPWGWTWVDDAPWGFAPFHYGRWVAVQGSGLGPGRRSMSARSTRRRWWHSWAAERVRCRWRRRGPPVAWFPLGPREVYVPTYRVSPVYVRAINTPHVVVTTVTINTTTVQYVNREVAVTAVPRDVFVRARPVAAAAVVVPREQARAAVVVETAVPARPERVIVSPAAGVRVAAPPAAVVSRRVVVRQTPPAVPATPGASQGPAPVAVAPARAVTREAERPAAPQPVARRRRHARRLKPQCRQRRSPTHKRTRRSRRDTRRNVPRSTRGTRRNARNCWRSTSRPSVRPAPLNATS